MRQAAEQVDLEGIRFFTQKSLYVQRVLRAMGMDGLERDMKRLSPAEREKSQFLRDVKGRLFEAARDLVERRYSIYAESANAEILERYLRSTSLSNIDSRDIERMKVIIRKMVKRLNDRHSRRCKRSRRGRLDFKRTLRHNMSYQGVLFDPAWKKKKVDRPEIVVLCDISRSVETFARFMLLFLHSLNEQVARITSFIFCSNLVEVSHIFKSFPVDEALDRLHKGAGLGVILGRTDYGRALEDFQSKGMARVHRRTTVMILGDARNNYNDPRSDILKRIQERSKKIIWLNPEPPPFWGTGDSEMNRYRAYCFLVRQCSTADHLARVVDSLLGMH
jgi:uncharacterized protein with von Willebrand factor type A (vWA) domain